MTTATLQKGFYIPKMWDGSSVLVEEGCDERNGSYPYEVYIYLTKDDSYFDLSYGRFVLEKKYYGGLNRLQDCDYWQFDSWGEAVKFAHRNWSHVSAKTLLN